MSATSNSDKSPSGIGVVFFAVLTALFSALLGFVYMTSFSAQAFSSQADYEASLVTDEGTMSAPKPGQAYYIEGKIAQTRSWESKRDLLASPGAQTVRLTEGEINAWMSAEFRPTASSAAKDVSGILVTPGVPNLAIVASGGLYLNVPTTISAFGSRKDFTVFARYLLTADSVELYSVNVSSAKVPLPRILGAKILKGLAKGFQSSEEYTIWENALARADSIRVEGNELVLQLR